MPIPYPSSKPSLSFSSQPAINLLDDTLLNTARRLIKLEREIHAYFPAALCKEFCAGGLHGQEPNAELVLVVAHSAAAARIRQSLPSLLAHLQSRAWGLSSLRIKVQPQHTIVRKQMNLVPHKRAILGDQGIDSLSALHATLEASPLRDALSSLLAHHKK